MLKFPGMGTEPLLHSEGPAERTGFSRVDLLTTLAMIGVLAVMTGSSIGSANRANSEIVCVNNVRQLTIAWQLYARENNEELVGAAEWTRGGKVVPNWTGGQWLEMPARTRDQVDPYAPKGIASSPLWKYVGDRPQIWRCPDDTTTGSHPDYNAGAPAPRVRSYTMNSWVGGPTWAGQNQWKVYTKLDDLQLPGPSGTFVIIDERPGSINDGYFPMEMSGFNPDSLQNPLAKIVDYPATHHSGGASVSYADGHVAVKVWQDSRTNPSADPTVEVPLNERSPNNPDVHWLQYRATRRIEQVHALRFGPARIVGDVFSAGTRIQDGHHYDVETSTDLVNWAPVGVVAPEGATGASVDAKVKGPGEKQFFRARRRE